MENFVERGGRAHPRPGRRRQRRSARSRGGVDSSVAAALDRTAPSATSSPASSSTTACCARDEAERVVDALPRRRFGDSPYQRRRRRRRASSTRLAGVDDPEQKRRIIGATFIEVFEDEAKQLADVALPRPGHALSRRHRVGVVQGPVGDHQEPPQRRRPARAHEAASWSSRCASCSRTRCASSAARSACPPSIVGRQPFPGPGLAIRILGAVTAERLAVLRAADAIIDEEIRAAGLYDASLAVLRRAAAGARPSASWATSAPTRT